MVPLYRGVSRRGGQGERVSFNVRTDRAPLDSYPLGALMFDYGLELATGVANIRSRCVFATTSHQDASSYGAVIQLELPSDTPCVYHPGHSDSIAMTALLKVTYPMFDDDEVEANAVHPLMDVLEKFATIDGEFDMTTWREVVSGFTVTMYHAPAPALVKVRTHFERMASKLGHPHRLADEAVAAFEESAKFVADGFVTSTVGELPNNPQLEVMIYGISQYTGVYIGA